MFPRVKDFYKELLAPTVDCELISYMQIRRSIGYLGLFLPFALGIGSFVLSECRRIQPSISHYYFTNMREIFEGTLFAVSLFLFTYKGKSRLDSITSNVAGFFCVLVALVPTDIRERFPCQEQLQILFKFNHSGTVHYASAILFFITLSFMSLAIFTISDKPKDLQTPQKRSRNVIYVICGLTMIGGIIGMGIWVTFFDNPNGIGLFVGETICLVAFGISWLTKGEALLKDQPEG